jgi:acetyl esterase/lipase
MHEKSRHLLDATVAAAVDRLPSMPLTRDTLAARRTAMAEMMDVALRTLPEIPGITMSEHSVPGTGAAPPVRTFVYRHSEISRRMPVLLWIHGGGYVGGRAEWDHHLAKTLARTAGCCVVSVDYRLAPESPFPGAIDDCYAVLQWVHENVERLAIDRERIGIAGISAGAGLAAALALMARDRDEVQLAFQCLLQPMLDDRHASDSYKHPFVGEFVWTASHNHVAWSALLGREPGSEHISSYAAAARAESLQGLPPAFIAVGALDLFVEESIEYARRLIRDGVPTELHVYPGACHAFQFLAPESPLAKSHDGNMIAALRRGLRIDEETVT